MIFRKDRNSQHRLDLDAGDRRRRGRRVAPEESDPGAAQPGGTGVPAAPGTGVPAAPGTRGAGAPGPYDADQVDTDTSRTGRIDFGGLQVRPREDLELRLQVDEESSTVLAVLLVQGESALELRAFAAPRSSGLWEEIRREMAAEASRRGGLVSELRGRYGPELEIVVPMQAPDGSTVTQASRIIGIDGPRWFLRATVLGQAVQDPQAAAPLLSALADVVVVRGKAPMAPRDLIPMNLPSE